MKKRVKFLTTFASLCLTVALMMFGVFAASDVKVKLDIQLGYTADAYVNSTIRFGGFMIEGTSDSGVVSPDDQVRTIRANYKKGESETTDAFEPVEIDFDYYMTMGGSFEDNDWKTIIVYYEIEIRNDKGYQNQGDWDEIPDGEEDASDNLYVNFSKLPNFASLEGTLHSGNYTLLLNDGINRPEEIQNRANIHLGRGCKLTVRVTLNINQTQDLGSLNLDTTFDLSTTEV